jgi:hypothetical protein
MCIFIRCSWARERWGWMNDEEEQSEYEYSQNEYEYSRCEASSRSEDDSLRSFFIPLHSFFCTHSVFTHASCYFEALHLQWSFISHKWMKTTKYATNTRHIRIPHINWDGIMRALTTFYHSFHQFMLSVGNLFFARTHVTLSKLTFRWTFRCQ